MTDSTASAPALDTLVPGVRPLVPVSACPHPFDGRRVDYMLPAGLTITQIIEAIQPDPLLRAHGVVFIGDRPVERAWWDRVRPKPGAIVSIRLLPSGGNARMAAMIGLMVLAVAIAIAVPFVAPLVAPLVGGMTAALAVTAAAGAVITIGATLAVNMLLPPPVPELAKNYGNDRPSYAITGARNRADPWGKVPFLLGRFKLTPPYAAMPWREIVGAKVYWRAIFAFAHGPIAIEDMRIGETAIGNYSEVESEFRRGYWVLNDRGTWSGGGYPADPAFGDTWTRPDATTITYNGLAAPGKAAAWDIDQGKSFVLFPHDVYEEGLDTAVTRAPDRMAVRSSQPGAGEIAIEIVFPRGIVHMENDPPGKKKERTQTIRIEQAPAGTTNWAHVLTKRITGKQATPLYWGHRWRPTDYGAADPLKRYDVRLSDHTGKQDEERNFGNWNWIALRTITAGNPVPVPGVAMMAVRILSTGQLQGTLDEFNAVCQTIARDWDVASGTWVWRPTSQPAALVRHVLQHPTRERPASDDQIDLARLAYWDAVTRGAARVFNGVADGKTSLYDQLTKIARVGRAVPTLRDLRFSVIIDEPKSAPVRLFTPRNSWDYEGELTHAALPHAYRIGYVDAARDWSTEEVMAYDDGRDAGNAVRVDKVEWPGIIDRNQAWREGRYHLAQQRLRREIHKITTDFEHLACERGDLVALQHDAIAVGLASARVAAVDSDGTSVTAVHLDAAVPMAAGKAYGFRARRIAGGTMRTDLYAVAGGEGETDTLTLSPPVPLADAPAPGDLVSYGEYARETLRCLIRDIEPRADLSARLTLIAEAEGVHDAERGAIPPYDPMVTLPMLRILPAPQVLAVRSDASVMLLTASRALVERVVFTLVPIGIQGARMHVLWRATGTDGPWAEAAIQDQTASSVAIVGIESGIAYDFLLQRTHPDYLTSPASLVANHLVIGRSEPPAGLQNLTIGIAGGHALLRWDLPADLDVQVGGWIVFRHSPLLVNAQWSASTTLARTGNTDQTWALMPLKPGTYMARVYDVDGRESAAIAQVTTVQASVLAFTPAASVMEDPAYAGVKDACQVAAGVLELIDGDFDTVADTDALENWDYGGTITAGVYHFAVGIDFGTVRRMRLTSRVMATAVNKLSDIDGRLDDLDSWPDIDGTGGAVIDASVWGRLTDDDPAGAAPAWGPPMRIDAAEITARAVGRLECRMSVRESSYNIQVSELRLTADQLA